MDFPKRGQYMKISTLLLVFILLLVGCTNSILKESDLYDSKIVSGSQLFTTIKNTQNEPIAIVLKNEEKYINFGARLVAFEATAFSGTLQEENIQYAVDPTEYIDPRDRYESMLIKDSKKNVIGLFLIKIPTHKD